MSSIDESLRTPHRSPLGRWIRIAMVATICVLSIRYLQSIKNQRDSSWRPAPSVETVRTSIQRGLDSHASDVSVSPLLTTFEQLRAMPRPSELEENRTSSADIRYSPLELQVWRFPANVIQVQTNGDNDFYFVIESGGLRGCAELPDPTKCKGSRFYKQIERLRSRLEAEFHPQLKPKKVGRKAILTGIGYFGTAGKNDNGARLLPLLDLTWEK